MKISQAPSELSPEQKAWEEPSSYSATMLAQQYLEEILALPAASLRESVVTNGSSYVYFHSQLFALNNNNPTGYSQPRCQFSLEEMLETIEKLLHLAAEEIITHHIKSNGV